MTRSTRYRTDQSDPTDPTAVPLIARFNTTINLATKLMKHTSKIIVVLLACAQALGAKTTEISASKPKSKLQKQRMEICFVVDTTGSMGGLIEGAKQKIWSIANELIGAKPTPDLKIGLVAFRDRGDEYVVKSFHLTDDIDSVYAELRKFKADGGGDTPESVNEALEEAVNKMAWSQDRDVLKIIFLVGDAPPHMDYANGPKYPDICKSAMKKEIVINTVQCGNIGDTTPVWQEIAKLSEGSFVAIAQTGNMAVIATPMDDKLAELNRKVGSTLIPYGDKALRREVSAKQAVSESAPASAAADRLSYNAKTGKAVQGAGELLDALAVGAIKYEAIEAKNLPEDLKSLDKEELKDRVEKMRGERSDLQKQIITLGQERDAYIAVETKRSMKEGSGDSFDQKVAEMIRKEAAKKAGK